ncbi:MAG: cysteine methyltransferase [Deltaproteobacteria bacterium HGW-Deltaproteobacteria-13]|nr:MAG: cysteine methyltransferase [Deltaproteobacteria bacterium HGW-Deltaproteobacteria-13]
MTRTMKTEIKQMNKKIISPTPFGSVCVVWRLSNDKPGIVNILLSRPGVPAQDRASALFPDSRKSSCVEIDSIAESIKASLEGEPVKFSLKLVDLSPYSKFQQSVLRAQYAIPRGSVSTYGLIAAHVGSPGGGRAVGNVMARNPFPILVPCHRTIRSGCHLGGFGGGTEMKRTLLEKEGIIFNIAGKVICPSFYYAPA